MVSPPWRIVSGNASRAAYQCVRDRRHEGPLTRGRGSVSRREVLPPSLRIEAAIAAACPDPSLLKVLSTVSILSAGHNPYVRSRTYVRYGVYVRDRT